MQQYRAFPRRATSLMRNQRHLARVGIESFRREKAYLANSGHTGPLPPANFLAISGGGDNGALAQVCWLDGRKPEIVHNLNWLPESVPVH